MGGVILLLLLGTQVLDWPWLAAMCGVALIFGLVRMRRRVPAPYRVAQSVDRILDLHDTLSTAYFYNRTEHHRKSSDEIREAQLAAAERVAREVPLGRAVPFSAPKSLYAMAVLALVASSLFALRYGMSRTLDLRPPLARMIFDVFHFSPKPETKLAHKDPKEQRIKDLLRQFGLPIDGEGDKTAGRQKEAPSAPSSQTEEARKQSGAGQEKTGATSAEEAKDKQDGSDKEQASADPSDDPRGQERGDQDQGGEQKAANSQQSANSQGESSSLMDKFRDAMANLLSRLKSQPRNGDGKQMAANSRGKPEIGQSRQNSGRKGAEANGKQSESGSNGEQQADQQGEGQQQAHNGPGKESGSESERAAKEGRSGIGREDGNKDIRAAEQLAAMGKISEIIGKRSQNLTGEVMVEVASGNQALRTAWSQSGASHAEAGGEIHRDEIPLAYQHYVQQYFEQIRKTPVKKQ